MKLAEHHGLLRKDASKVIDITEYEQVMADEAARREFMAEIAMRYTAKLSAPRQAGKAKEEAAKWQPPERWEVLSSGVDLFASEQLFQPIKSERSYIIRFKFVGLDKHVLPDLCAQLSKIAGGYVWLTKEHRASRAN